jgi:rhodanese-related sulfurtransferase
MSTQISEICTTNARAQSQLGALFIDVREPVEAAALAFDAPEVINLPWSQLAQRWQELPTDRELVTVCFNGDKSQQASAFLLAQGLKNVHPMRGGMLLWMQKGYPVIGKRFNNTLEK